MLHTRTNNIMLFIHNSFGGLTSSQTMYTKPLFGTHTPTYTHTHTRYLHTNTHTYTRSHIYVDTRRILTHSVDVHSVHDTCMYAMRGGH